MADPDEGRDVSGDGRMSGEKRRRKDGGNEKAQDVKESQVLKKSRRQEDSKQNVRVWSVSYSSTVDLIGGEKKIRQSTCRRENDEVGKCVVVRNPSVCRETDRKQDSEETDQRDESIDGDQYVVWVQCSKPECGKWRALSDGVDPSVLPDDWTCKNNTDPTFSSCSAPEEKSSVPEEEMFFYRLVPGSLVWAQQSGYPWWPAIVEQDPNTKKYLEFRTESDLTPSKCHVTYFGEPVTRAWVNCSRLKDYAELSADQFLNDVDQYLKDSINMAKEALKLSLKERLVRFGFCSRYASDRESSEDSDISEMLELFCGKAGNDFSDEDSWSKRRKTPKERKRKGRRSEWGKEGNETYKEGEKKKRVKKSLKEGKEGGKEKPCPCALFTLPGKKKEHKTDRADQTVPQSAMKTSMDMTFHIDNMEGKRERVQCTAGEWGEDQDEDDKEYEEAPEDRFSLMLLGEE